MTFLLFTLVAASELSLSSTAEFYRARPHSETRPMDWPAKLTLTPVPLNLEEMKARLVGTWILAFTCSGAPLDAEWLRGNYRLDGHYNSGGLFIYTPTHASRFLTPNAKGYPRSLQKDFEGEYFAEKTSDTRMRLSYRPGSGFKGLSPIEFEWQRVEETGEDVLMGHEDSVRCLDGSILKILFIPVPVS